MASNRNQDRGRYLYLNVGSALLSGAPCVVGLISGVLQMDALTSSPYNATIDTEGVYNLAVKGEDENGNKAIAVGDIVYFDTEAGYLNVNAEVDSVRFGWALDAVTSGSTTTIRVKLGPS